VFTALVTASIVTHVLQWPADGPPMLGFIPWDLGYHLLWMVGATGVVLYMTEVLWTDPEEDETHE
jgi:hypothetical protein